jgi:DNA-binding transcriptional LysR family regulator
MNTASFDHQNILAYLAVAETGSFSAAASKLFITQPAVSKRIALLEQQIGLPLFERLTRQISLTEAGERLLPTARQVRLALEEFASTAQQTNQPLTGRLRIALSHYVGLHLLPDVLTEFSQRYPAVWLDLQFMDSEAAILAVAQGAVRLAYGTLAPGTHSLTQATAIWREQLVPLCAQRHVTASPHALHALAARLPIILPAAQTSTRQAIDCWLISQNITPLAVIEVNQLDSIALLVATGIGWSVLPETLQNPKLARIDTPNISPPERALGLITRANSLNAHASHRPPRPSHQLAQAFMDTVFAACCPRDNTGTHTGDNQDTKTNTTTAH